MIMNEIKILYHGDARLADWGETRAGGKYIKLFLDDKDEDPLLNFRGLDIGNLKKSGYVFNLTISEGDIIAMATIEKKPYGNLAAQLFINHFFCAPQIIKVLSPSLYYRDWLRRQPSCISGKFDNERNKDIDSLLFCVESGNEGIEEYSYIPVTGDELINLTTGTDKCVLNPKQMLQKRTKYLTLWGKKRLCHLTEYSSVGDIPPEKLVEWCNQHNISQYLPRAYRDA